MRNKKLLAMASLLCTATLCAGVGVVALGNEANTVVSAETPVYTKDIGGVTYTFEQDFNNLTYTGFGSLVNNYGMKTSVGATVMPHANNASAYNPNHKVKSLDNTAFVSTSNGVAFQFDITGQVKIQGRMELIYGNIGVNFVFFGGNRLKIGTMHYFADDSNPATLSPVSMTYGNANEAVSKSHYNLYEGCFTTDSSNTYNTMADGWMEIGMHKNKCTAIDGDETAATGYWLSLYIKTQSGKTIVLHDGYEAKDMYTTAYDAVSLGFAPGNTDAVAKNSFMKIRDCTATMQINAETSTDIADWETVNTTGANDELYLKGVEQTAAGYRVNTNMVAQGYNSQLSRGIEFRMKETAPKASVSASKIDFFISVRLGANLLNIYPNTALNTWNVNCMYNTSEYYNPTGANVNSYVAENAQTNVLAFEYGAEYAVKAMRLAVNPNAHDKATGSVVRLYMAKVDETTGMPADGWDDVPVYEHYTASSRTTKNNGENCWGVQSANNNVAHTTFIRSNKYAGVKTIVDGVQTLHKVPYGTDFTFANLITGENTICAGWSKGAETYSADDYLAANTVFENMTESKLDCTYRALTMTLEADKAASLRIRKRGENPHEISLNWAVTATDSNNLGKYFGGIKFGYKLTVQNAVGQTDATEEEVLKYTDGYTTPYAYSITQSNIDDYTLEFVCQAYVELNGVKYYTAMPSIENDGRSVNDVATAVLNDVRDNPVEEGAWNYANAVEVDGVTKYTYLTAWQYNFIKNYIANA